MFSNLLAKQLSKPAEVLGQLVFAPLWNRRNIVLNEVTLQRLKLQPDDRVLDVGFGGGFLLGKILPWVPQGFLAGVDISPAMVNFCEKRYRTHIQSKKLELHLGSAEYLPFPADRFTKVCSVNSIFYWPDAPRAIAEFFRVLQTEGLLVLCFTSKESLASRSFAKKDLMLFEQDEVAEMMKSAGFSTITRQQARDRYRTFYCIAGCKTDPRD